MNDLDWTAGDDDEDQVALQRRGRMEVAAGGEGVGVPEREFGLEVVFEVLGLVLGVVVE